MSPTEVCECRPGFHYLCECSCTKCRLATEHFENRCPCITCRTYHNNHIYNCPCSECKPADAADLCKCDCRECLGTGLHFLSACLCRFNCMTTALEYCECLCETCLKQEHRLWECDCPERRALEEEDEKIPCHCDCAPCKHLGRHDESQCSCHAQYVYDEDMLVDGQMFAIGRGLHTPVIRSTTQQKPRRASCSSSPTLMSESPPSSRGSTTSTLKSCLKHNDKPRKDSTSSSLISCITHSSGSQRPRSVFFDENVTEIVPSKFVVKHKKHRHSCSAATCSSPHTEDTKTEPQKARNPLQKLAVSMLKLVPGQLLEMALGKGRGE